MYPRLTDFFERLFGVDLPFTIYSFGAMVAVAVLTAAWIASRELDRMHGAGLISGVRVPDETGKKGKRAFKEASPSALMGAVTVIAVVGGFAGARLFHILENLDRFVADPFGMLFTTGGFTFYGGLVVAGFGIAYYVRRKGVELGRFIDALAPTLILAYGIGRIGCHLAGDGDWGIVSDIDAKPGWLPMWLWAETYPKNILSWTEQGGYQPLPEAVYPTPLYEFAAAVLLFGILWRLRKHSHKPGWLFSLYLVFVGIERFFIEKIRVNNEFEILGIMVTQAEVISTLLMTVGAIALYFTWSRSKEDATAAPVSGTSPKAPLDGGSG